MGELLLTEVSFHCLCADSVYLLLCLSLLASLCLSYYFASPLCMSVSLCFCIRVTRGSHSVRRRWVHARLCVCSFNIFLCVLVVRVLSVFIACVCVCVRICLVSCARVSVCGVGLLS